MFVTIYAFSNTSMIRAADVVWDSFVWVRTVPSTLVSDISCFGSLVSLSTNVQTNMEKFGTDIRKILCELDKLNISESDKNELKECAKAILTFGVDKLGTSCAKSDSVICDDIVMTLIRFAETTVNIMNLCKIIVPHYSILCNTVVEVVGHVFTADVASLVLNKSSPFNAVEADFKARCLATNSKVTQCITYMQGLPNPVNLDRNEKHFHLQLMASDVPVHTGLDELLVLGIKINDILKSSNERTFRQLMEKVQLYCCMTTLRELFLLYRYSIQSTFEADNEGVKLVCEGQRKHDEEVLRFLYKPTVQTAKFSCQYLSEEWPIVSSFLERRGLHADDLSHLSGAIVQIKSLQYQDRYLTVGKNRFSVGAGGIRCERNPEEQCTLFQLQGGKDNVFTIYPCVCDTPCHVSDKSPKQLEASAGVPSTVSGFWKIQKLYSEATANSSPSYMICLAAENNRYLYTSHLNGQVYAKYTAGFGPRYLWQLIAAEHIYFRRFGVC